MAWRDRFFTVTTARAILSWRLLLGVAVGVGLGVLGAPIILAVVGGVGVYAGSVALAVPKAPKAATIDPFAVGEPWRHFLKDAQRSRQQLLATVRGTPAGPLRDRLSSIAERLDAGLQEGWQIAKRGNEIDAAVRRLDPTRLRSKRSTLEAQPDRSPEVDRALAAVDGQLATVDRLKELSTTTAGQLRLSQARLDELVARAAEVSIGSASTETYAGEVDQLVLELESLRQAVQELQ